MACSEIKNKMNETFIFEKDPGNFIVKVSDQKNFGFRKPNIITICDKEDAIRACTLAN